MEQELQEAFDELDLVATDAIEDGETIPAPEVFDTVRRLLPELYEIAPLRFGIDGTSEGYITIDARGDNNSIVVIMCEPQGALCIAITDGNPRRQRYSSADELPDEFVREALLALR